MRSDTRDTRCTLEGVAIECRREQGEESRLTLGAGFFPLGTSSVGCLQFGGPDRARFRATLEVTLDAPAGNDAAPRPVPRRPVAPPTSTSTPAAPPACRQGPVGLTCKHLNPLGFHFWRSSRFTDSTSILSPGRS